jgi:exopolysaccharide biosynthesis polyprenyl glycosylphosphotransferase
MDAPKHLNKTSPWRLRLGERRVLMAVGDFLVAWVSLLLAVFIWSLSDLGTSGLMDFIDRRFQAWFLALPLGWLILLVDSYDSRRSDDWRKTFRAVTTSFSLALIIYVLIYFTSEPNSLPRRGVAVFLVTTWFGTLVWRRIYIRVLTTPQFMHRVLLVGAGSSGIGLLQVINELWPPPYFLVGLIDDDPEKQGQTFQGFDVLGGSGKLNQIIEDQNITDVIVAISGRMDAPMFKALLDAQTAGVGITRMPVAYEDLLGRVPVHYLEADWMLRNFVDEARIGAFYRFFKRTIDVLGGLVGCLILIVLAPFIILVILIDDGWPVVFSQIRAGKGGVPYTIYKFRTMRKDAEKDGAKLAAENDARATRTGGILRRTHLDEWPQFINVLRGDMSLVGPRPERPEFVEHFVHDIPFYRARLIVKPGIAGWAQIHLNYAASIEEMVIKLEYDLYYIKHRSLWMDFLIMLRTFATIIGFRGR